MSDPAVKTLDQDNRSGEAAPQELTDGFHLVIDALKLNDINTIYNVPGIPITDLGRYMQAEGMRVLSFRHEQHAGYAAANAGFTSWRFSPHVLRIETAAVAAAALLRIAPH